VTGADAALLIGLIVGLFLFLWIDLHFFARGREPSFREAVWWSVGWLALSLLAAVPVWLLEGGEDAVLYTTVYLIERSLSLDNLFVFILLFSYFGVPYERRPRLLYWGIVAALAMRGAFILGGTELIEQFHVVIYLLGGALIVLAVRIWRGVAENVDPDRNLMVRAVRRFYPVTGEFHGGRWFVTRDGRRYATPIFLCLAAIVFADIAFAIDSIPAAFAITTDPLLICPVRARGEPGGSLPLPGRDDRDRARPGRREAADRGHRQDRAGGEPGRDRRGVHDRDRAVDPRRSARPGRRPAPDRARRGDAAGPRFRARGTRTRHALKPARIRAPARALWCEIPA
jgi:tellurite resistance protein TerC